MISKLHHFLFSSTHRSMRSIGNSSSKNNNQTIFTYILTSNNYYLFLFFSMPVQNRVEVLRMTTMATERNWPVVCTVIGQMDKNRFTCLRALCTILGVACQERTVAVQVSIANDAAPSSVLFC